MNNLIEQLSEFFQKHERKFYQLGDKPVLEAVFNGKWGRWNTITVVNDDRESVNFISLFPSHATEARRSVAAELLARLNFSLKHGNFELDYKDGEIRFKTSHFAPSQSLTAEEMEQLIFSNLNLVDTYYEVIMNVLHAGLTPERALARHKARSRPKRANHKPRFEFN